MKKLTIVLLVALASCKPEPQYPYRAELDKFLSRELNYSIGEKEIILVMLPLETCNPCLKGTIDLLLRNQNEKFVVVVSTRRPEEIKEYQIDKLGLPNDKLFIDSKNMYSRYEIGVQAPIILHFVDGQCVFYSETTSSNHQRIIEHFSWS